MTGRDPNQSHRAATPLELLFDLAFVVAFGQAGDQLAHLVAAGHIWPGILGFLFAIGGTCWAWINFSWFASAYDTDDWFYRLTTMVQMIGVVIYALGMPAFFQSLEHGGFIDNRVLLAGYIVMRVAMVAQWLRAARQDKTRRRSALTYAFFIGIAQLAWVLLTVFDVRGGLFIVAVVVIFFLEFLGPRLAERKTANGTPWNASHIAERYGLLAIITLGEGVFGTVAAVSALVESQGWTKEAVLIVVAGIGLTFGLWWNYFMLPSAEVLAKFRERALPWGYLHILLFGSIAAIGAGLHISADVIAGHSEIGLVGAVLAVAIPGLVFSISLFGIALYLVRELDRLHIWLFAATVAVLLFSIVLAGWAVPLGWCLLVITLAPTIVIVGYETIGHRHQEAILARVLG